MVKWALKRPRIFSFSLSLPLLPLHGSFIFLGVLPEHGIKPQSKVASGAYPYSLLIGEKKNALLC